MPEATKKGYALVCVGGCFDWDFPESKTRRGRVQENGMVCPTLICSPEIYVYEGVIEDE